MAHGRLRRLPNLAVVRRPRRPRAREEPGGGRCCAGGRPAGATAALPFPRYIRTDCRIARRRPWGRGSGGCRHRRSGKAEALRSLRPATAPNGHPLRRPRCEYRPCVGGSGPRCDLRNPASLARGRCSCRRGLRARVRQDGDDDGGREGGETAGEWALGWLPAGRPVGRWLGWVLGSAFGERLGTAALAGLQKIAASLKQEPSASPSLPEELPTKTSVGARRKAAASPEIRPEEKRAAAGPRPDFVTRTMDRGIGR
ncbi:protein of unknown function [Methylacidimicrobium sp. AP8]|nr:protein of unknown function [Methylacidimicrobium sp. AP8]